MSFLLFDRFSNHVLANVLEPLRAANGILGREAYRWRFLTLDGTPVRSSSGLPVHAEGRFGQEGRGDLLCLLPSYGYREAATPHMSRALRAAAARYGQIAGLDAGSWLLAKAGLLEGQRATIHAEEAAAFEEAFPEVAAERVRWVEAGRFITAAGALPCCEWVLHWIAQAHGKAVSLEIAALFMLGDAEAGPRAVVSDPLVARALVLMEANLETPLTISSVATRLGVSQSQLDRRMHAALGASPQEVSHKLRRDASKRLLREGRLTVTEVAMRCGWESLASFSRAFRRAEGLSPRAWQMRDASGGSI